MHVVGAVEALALIAIHQHRALHRRQIEPVKRAPPRISDQQPALMIDGKAVGASFADDLAIRVGQARRREENRDTILARPFAHDVGGRIGEQQISALPHPNRPLGPLDAGGDRLHPSAGRDDPIQLRRYAAQARGKGLREGRRRDQRGAGEEEAAAIHYSITVRPVAADL